MKKSIFGVIVATGIILLMMFCYKDSHQASSQRVITWERLDTFVFVNPMYRVAYPDYFEVNTAELDSGHVSFYYTINGNSVALRSYSIPRYELWDVKTFANSVERFIMEIGNDTITMKELHLNYFYMESRAKNNEYKCYEKYVLGDEDIFVLALDYPEGIEDNQVERLKELVHDWNPK